MAVSKDGLYDVINVRNITGLVGRWPKEGSVVWLWQSHPHKKCTEGHGDLKVSERAGGGKGRHETRSVSTSVSAARDVDHVVLSMPSCVGLSVGRRRLQSCT